jgi:ABC-type uncharacterized transport system ATPase subunit
MIETPPELPRRTILDLRDLTVSFDGFKALNALTLQVDKASCAASSVRTAPGRRR